MVMIPLHLFLSNRLLVKVMNSVGRTLGNKFFISNDNKMALSGICKSVILRIQGMVQCLLIKHLGGSDRSRTIVWYEYP